MSVFMRNSEMWSKKATWGGEKWLKRRRQRAARETSCERHGDPRLLVAASSV